MIIDKGSKPEMGIQSILLFNLILKMEYLSEWNSLLCITVVSQWMKVQALICARRSIYHLMFDFLLETRSKQLE